MNKQDYQKIYREFRAVHFNPQYATMTLDWLEMRINLQIGRSVVRHFEDLRHDRAIREACAKREVETRSLYPNTFSTQRRLRYYGGMNDAAQHINRIYRNKPVHRILDIHVVTCNNPLIPIAKYDVDNFNKAVRNASEAIGKGELEFFVNFVDKQYDDYFYCHGYCISFSEKRSEWDVREHLYDMYSGRLDGQYGKSKAEWMQLANRYRYSVQA